MFTAAHRGITGIDHVKKNDGGAPPNVEVIWTQTVADRTLCALQATKNVLSSIR